MPTWTETARTRATVLDSMRVGKNPPVRRARLPLRFKRELLARTSSVGSSSSCVHSILGILLVDRAGALPFLPKGVLFSISGQAAFHLRHEVLYGAGLFLSVYPYHRNVDIRSNDNLRIGQPR